ncbi:mitochondrial genome maintenance exonuclease 1 isoform X1 [Lingula anatina]|uniref:Mitochondrial genome maintenance exonuclease 1 n=1 Tax=Lingula anatina TaxID=7574 RepID=A0A1S3JUK2_LINAN|nr:mitochondrial genome maintenance exonuclease 1 isoform X1 [Lingula anatina]XP_013414051.1 mitochondrial genome maintenance exonuclease 1 isoform X1 [Lingula anatina]|eukprot:XP_013414050.1 mitochondrial genome maintenance exonuclease 1 isoform X1 [Lingula anatina]
MFSVMLPTSQCFTRGSKASNLFCTLRLKEHGMCIWNLNLRFLNSASNNDEADVTKPTGNHEENKARANILKDTSTNSMHQILHFPLMQGTDGDLSPLLQTDAGQVNLPTVDLPSSMKSAPSVTKILQATMPSEQIYVLKQWEKRMIRELGEEGFEEQRRETFRTGHNLHSALRAYLGGVPEEDVPVVPSITGYWDSVQKVLKEITDVKAVECNVHHPYLQYGGVFDCIGRYRDKLCVIDWKTSQKPKKLLDHTYDNPLQIAAYIGAVNFDKTLDVKVDYGLLVISYPNGEPAHAHVINKRQCYDYWYLWLRRLRAYWLAVNKKASETNL